MENKINNSKSNEMHGNHEQSHDATKNHDTMKKEWEKGKPESADCESKSGEACATDKNGADKSQCHDKKTESKGACSSDDDKKSQGACCGTKSK